MSRGSVGGALLVAGTTSDAGKSVLAAGICRWLARQGVRVAPFKAQNMSLNSMVTADGAEIGRAQVMQAAAARATPEATMNPVLLKPGSDRRSQVVLLGQPIADVDAMSYRDLKAQLQQHVLASLADLRSRYDAVICEGAGSPTEINLRDRDIANLGLAREAGMPVLVVGDIDRGGVFASMFGTLALLDTADQALIAGFVINKFRGDPRLLEPGLAMLRELTGRTTLGVLPWLDGLWIDVEDSLDLAAERGPVPGEHLAAPRGSDVLRVAVVRYPRISNFTDTDALAAEPGVLVRFVGRPEELADADLVILPGSRATVDDLGWLRERGFVEPLRRRAAVGGPILGICGGYQMLAREIHDDVESGVGAVPGLGLLPAVVRFAPTKMLRRPRGTAYGEAVEGYEIHHGVVESDAAESFLDGCTLGAVRGTTWHGAFENDGFRRAFLSAIAHESGRDFVPADDVCFADVRERRLDALGDLVADHLDTNALRRLLDDGPPAGARFVPPGAPAPTTPAAPAYPSRPATPTGMPSGRQLTQQAQPAEPAPSELSESSAPSALGGPCP